MKRYFFVAIFVLIQVLCVVSCRQRDVRVVTVHVPKMKNAACARVVQGAVMRVAGVQHSAAMGVDLEKRTVTVSYDSMITATKNIEAAIANIGFVANGRPADVAAAEKLPEECGMSSE